MATQVISNGPAHFMQGSDVYSDMYPTYPTYEGYASENSHSYMYNTEQQPVNYPSADAWANQSNTVKRMSSRSPSLQYERTPIRHHKSGISRSRSTSKSEALLAYATDHSLQSQQHSGTTTPSLAQNASSTSPALFNNQGFTNSSINSQFVQHAPYYDSSNTHFQDIHAQPGPHSNAMSDYYSHNRSDMHVGSIAGSGLTAHDALYLQNQGQPRQPTLSALGAAPLGFPPIPRPLESTSGAIEVSSSRNKPQCWDHGCNGRQFSTFSNLLRHQREKSGTAAKARCPHCGTEFTRTTARNGHMYGGKCKGLPDSNRQSPNAADGNSDNEGHGR